MTQIQAFPRQKQAYLEWVGIARSFDIGRKDWDLLFQKDFLQTQGVVESNPLHYDWNSSLSLASSKLTTGLQKGEPRIAIVILYYLLWYPDKSFIPLVDQFSFKNKTHKKLKEVVLRYLKEYDESEWQKIISKVKNDAPVPGKESEKKKSLEDVSELLHVDLISIEIGMKLIPLIENKDGILERIQGIRRAIAREMGLVVPPIRIRDNQALKGSEYRILVRGNELGRCELKLDKVLALEYGENSLRGISGIPVKDPAYHMPAIWVPLSEKEKLEKAGLTVVDGVTVLITHLKEIVTQHAFRLLTRQDVQGMVDTLLKKHPAVVLGIIPDRISIVVIHEVLKNLLRERVSIRNLLTLFESLTVHEASSKDAERLTEQVRIDLSQDITLPLLDESRILKPILLTQSAEAFLEQSLMDTPFGKKLCLSEKDRAALFDQIRVLQKKHHTHPLVILAPGTLRPHLRKILETEFPRTPVLKPEEIADGIKAAPLGTIEK